MKQEDINKAFYNRWRIKRDANSNVFEGIGDYCETIVRAICRDFFEAGICLGEGEHCQPIPMSAIVKAAEEVAFEEWWNLYDKKRGKEKCMAKWNKLSLEEKDACLNATPAYVASTPDKAYRKDPLTYLNGKCWNDEIIFKDNGNKPTKQDPRDKLADVLVG